MSVSHTVHNWLWTQLLRICKKETAAVPSRHPLHRKTPSREKACCVEQFTSVACDLDVSICRPRIHRRDWTGIELLPVPDAVLADEGSRGYVP